MNNISVDDVLAGHHSDDAFVCDTLNDKPCNCWVKQARQELYDLISSEAEEYEVPIRVPYGDSTIEGGE